MLVWHAGQPAPSFRPSPPHASPAPLPPPPPGFHNATLYEALRPSVAPLVALLRDDEDKTRANAAGALGNLVRNSSQLCSELIKVRGRGWNGAGV